MPLQWLDNINNIVYWPPKRNRPLSYCINEWLLSDQNWQKFDRTAVLLEAGTRTEAEQTIQFITDNETRGEPESN